ncbi:MAG: hypothetical protein WCO44_07050 [Bacteroidota bacterium]
MNKKSKKLLVFSLLLFVSIVVVALGLKYIPLHAKVKLSSETESEFENPKKAATLPPHTLYYDFELAPGVAMPDGFKKGQAHSGQYSVKAFGQNAYSVTVERTIREVGMENMKAAALSAWIYVFPTTNEVKGSMVFSVVNDKGESACWQSIGVNDPEVPRGRWFKITGVFDLSAMTFKPENKIKIYFWNNSHTDILIDDYRVVLGSEPARRGDSAWADMTKPAGFSARFNYPPFRVELLEKVSQVSTPKASEIGPGDQVVAGSFQNTGADGLFLVREDGSAGAFVFCPEKKEFRKVTVDNALPLAALGRINKVLKGKFLGTAGDQVVISGSKGWMLAALEPAASACSAAAPLHTGLKVLWKSTVPASGLCAGNFSGGQRSEILSVSDDGSWQLMSFDQQGNGGGAWKVFAEDRQSPVKEWILKNRVVTLSGGRFLSHTATDQVLTVGHAAGEAKSSYTILRFSPSRMRWESVYPEKHDFCGKTIGLDTLKTSDIFFAMNSGDGGDGGVLRYNRDWRFDLKEIGFNDSTFIIRNSLDFHGYTLDYNPKYYESLVLIPGHFLTGTGISFLAVGHMTKGEHYEAILPDFTDLYSFTTKK